MAINTKARRHVALLDQDVVFPDGGNLGTAQERSWAIQHYYDATPATPPVPVPGSGLIDDGLSADFYGGTLAVVSSLSHEATHIALNGRPYLIDVTKYSRTILDSATPQTDDAAEPGEKSLSRSGFWSREQTDWSFGAGQELFDITDVSNRSRFAASKGVDCWTPRRLCLLNDTAKRFTSASTNISVFSVAGRLWLVDNTNLRHTTDPDVETPNFTAINCTDPITSVTTDGNRIYVAFGGAFTVKVVSATSPAGTAALGGTETPNLVHFANGRLFAAKANEWYELSSAGVKTAIKTDARSGWAWTAIAGMPSAVFAAGTVGDVSEVYSVRANPDTGALTAPIWAGGLPFGETILAMVGYPPAGVVVLGTSRGVRVATVDGQSLSIGELIVIPGGVSALHVHDRFCWFAWTNPDTESTGLGRLDLSVNTSNATFVPAYAMDLQARDTQGTVQGVATFGSRRYFVVNGSGLWAETQYLVPNGWVESGHIRYSVLPDKIFTGVALRHDPLAGGVSASITFDDGTTRTLGLAATGGGVVTVLDDASGVGLSASLRVGLTRSVGDPTEGPCLRAWELNALPRPKRVFEFVLPVILRTFVEDIRGNEMRFDPLAEVRVLDALASSNQLVTYQEGASSWDVRVASVAIPEGSVRGWQRNSHDQIWFESTVFVRLLSKEA